MVRLAEKMGKAGIASFRIDFTGLGDSIGPPGRQFVRTSLFEDRVADIKSALDYLQASGYRHFAVQGTCSGAYHAFRSSLADQRIGMLLLVNIPLFEYNENTCRSVTEQAALPWYHFRNRLANKQSWVRLFSGRFSVAAFLHGRVCRFWTNAKRFRSNHAEEGSANFPRAAMKLLSRRGVRTLFLFGPGEMGYYVVEEYFGPRGSKLTKLENVGLKVFTKFEHAMGQAASQQAAAHAMLRQILSWQSYLNAPEGIRADNIASIRRSELLSPDDSALRSGIPTALRQ